MDEKRAPSAPFCFLVPGVALATVIRSGTFGRSTWLVMAATLLVMAALIAFAAIAVAILMAITPLGLLIMSLMLITVRALITRWFATLWTFACRSALLPLLPLLPFATLI
jgi:hypothetical protein